ncbi:hypothetical protein V8E55_006987 [Tylopilus felleus]
MANPEDPRDLINVPLHKCPMYDGKVKVFNAASATFFAPSDISGGMQGMDVVHIHAFFSFKTQDGEDYPCAVVQWFVLSDEPNEDTGMWILVIEDLSLSKRQATAHSESTQQAQDCVTHLSAQQNEHGGLESEDGTMNEATFGAQVQEDATENKAKEDYYAVTRQISEMITKQPLIIRPNTPTVPVLLVSAPTSSSSNTATPFPPRLFYP